MDGNGKGLIQKLKLGLAGLAVAGSNYFNSFNAEAQENYIPKYNTFAHKMLMIEDSINTQDSLSFNMISLKTLDDLIDNSKNYIQKKENYAAYEVEKISMKINSDIKKQIPSLNKDKDFVFSLIYSAIGEENKIPFNLIVDPSFPENTSVKYSNSSLKVQMLNGRFLDLTEMKIPKELENSIYFRDLNEKEILSLVYYKKALKAFEKEEKYDKRLNKSRNFNKTLEYCNKALEINPKLLEARKLKTKLPCPEYSKECREEAEKIDELENLELYLTRYNTLAHRILAIEDSGSVNLPFPNLKALDKLIDQSKNYIQKKENYTKAEIEKISKNIYSSIKKEFKATDFKKDTCLRYSLIYQAIGEANEIPFHLVILPRSLDMSPHLFVRYDQDGFHDFLNQNNPLNKEDVNIETTSGEIHSDEYYIKNFYLIKENLKNTDYLKNLNEKEIISLGYYLRSIENRTKSYYPEEEMESLNKAIELNENFIEAYKLKALHYMDSYKVNTKDPKNFKESLENYKKVLEIYSDDLDSYVHKSYLERKLIEYGELKDHNKVINTCTQGLKRIKEITKAYPDAGTIFGCYLSDIKSDLYYYRSDANKELKNLKESEKDYDLFMFYSGFGPAHMMYMINKSRKEGFKYEDK